MKQKLLILGAQMAIGPWLRDAGEGVHGLRLKAWYWWWRGKKTLWGFLIALFGAALAVFAPQLLITTGATLAAIGVVAVNVGLLDKGVHTNVQIPAWFTETFHALLGYGAALSALVGLVAHLTPPLWADRLDLVCLGVTEACLFISSFMTDKPYKYTYTPPPPVVDR